MVAYNFQRRFVRPIEDRTKFQTMRNERKRHARAGEELQLYAGMRHRSCRLIRVATCTAALPITLCFRTGLLASVTIAALHLTDGDLDDFARMDGFADAADLSAFWRGEHQVADTDWSGVLIRWKP